MKISICKTQINYYLCYLCDTNKALYDYWKSFFFDKQNNKIKDRWNCYNLNQLKEDISLQHKFTEQKTKQH